MSVAKATMTPSEVAFWEQRLRDGRLWGMAGLADGTPCLECGEPTRIGERCKQRHVKCYGRWRYRVEHGQAIKDTSG